MGFHVHGQLLEGQWKETVPGKTVPASGDFRAPFSKSWHFPPPGTALPHEHFHSKPAAPQQGLVVGQLEPSVGIPSSLSPRRGHGPPPPAAPAAPTALRVAPLTGLRDLF